MKLKVFAFWSLCCFITVTHCFGQATVIAWKTERGIEYEQNSTTTHNLLQTGILSRGGGVEYIDNSTYSYVGLFPFNNPTKADAISSNAYYQIVLQAKPGAVMSLNSLTARLRRGNVNSPNMYRWRYSINGTDFYDLGPGDVTLTTSASDDTNGDVQAPIDLSKVCDLQNISSGTQVIFRLYAWGRKGSETAVTSNFGFGKSYFSSTANNPIVITGVVEMPVNQAPIVSWLPPSADEDVTLPATVADANITASLKRGPGLTFSDNSTYTYTSIFPQNASKAEAVSGNTYYEVTVQAKSGYYLNLDKLAFRLRRSSAVAPNAYRWAYSLNGASFTDVGPGDITLTMAAADDTNGEDQCLIDLSGISALRNVPSSTTVTFRCYIWGATANNTNIGFGKSQVKATNTKYNALAFYGSVRDFITLPVQLTTFTGQAERNTVKLSWTTASERNNSRFEILRSASGKPESFIGTVTGGGTSNTARHYNFTDYTPFRGINYYRLRQVDNDGKTDLSKAIAVKIGIMSPELRVTVSETAITAYLYSAAEGKGTIQVNDMMGRLLANKPVAINTGNNTWNIPLTNAKGGIYVLSVMMADGKQLYAKFYK